jgi:ABC-type multidrug transport system fused ATPase/permease subunit
MVFDEGRLVELGPHRDLVEAGGVYQALYSDWETGTAAM